MNDRCSKCKHGRHKLHEETFVDKEGAVRACKCRVCVPRKKGGS